METNLWLLQEKCETWQQITQSGQINLSVRQQLSALYHIWYRRNGSCYVDGL